MMAVVYIWYSIVCMTCFLKSLISLAIAASSCLLFCSINGLLALLNAPERGVVTSGSDN